MRPLLRLLGLFIVGALLHPAPLLGQEQPKGAELIGEIRAAYRTLDFEGAERRAEVALEQEQYQRFSPEQLTELHTILALVKYARDQADEARQQFRLALSLKPNLQLDPLLVSPKILAFFEEVRQEVPQTVAPGTVAPPPVRYVLVEDPRVPASLRSAVLPGWGQLYKGEPVKGRVLVGLWGAAALGSVATHAVMLQRRQAYNDLDAGDSSDAFEDAYTSMNAWNKIRMNVQLVAAGIWAYSYVDALLSGRPTQPQARAQTRITVSPTLGSAAPQVYLRVRF